MDNHRLIGLAFYVAGTLLVGELVIRPAFGLTLSDLFFSLALVAVIAEASIRRDSLRLLLPWSFILGVALFTVGGLVSSYFSIHRRQSILELVKLDYVLLVWIWIGPQIVKSTAHLLLVIRVWTISAALAGAGAVVQFVFGDVIPNTHSVFGRMTGLTQSVGDLGGVTAIAIVPSLMLAVDSRASRVNRFVGILAAALMLAGLILSGSVTGFVAAAVGGIAWLVMTRPGWGVVLAVGSLVIVGLGIISLQARLHGVDPLTRLVTVLSGPGDRATGRTRLQLDLADLNAIRAHPLVGVGLDTSSYFGVAGNYVHNILLEVWLGGGLIALAGLLIMLGTVVGVGLSTARGSSPERRRLAAALFASFVAFLVFGMAQPALQSRYAWLPAAMLMILRQLNVRDSPTPVQQFGKFGWRLRRVSSPHRTPRTSVADPGHTVS